MAELYQSYLNGKKIFIRNKKLTSGNKLASFDYPFQNKRYNQYLGVKPKEFTLEIVIFNDDLNNPLNYEAKKREIILELEKQQPCILIDSFDGEQTLDIADWRTTEEISSLGKCVLEVDFKEGTKNIYPVIANISKENILSKKTEFSNLQNNNIAKNLNSVSKFKQGFKSLKSKTNKLINGINNQVDKVRAVSENINQITSFITDFQTNINSILIVPDQLAGSVTGLINSLTNLTTNPLDSIFILKSLFGFGSDDKQSNIETINNTKINENNNLLNFSIQSLALANCYEVISDIEFKNLDELEYYQNILDTQYLNIVNNQSFDIFNSQSIDNKENVNNDIFKSLGSIKQSSNQLMNQIAITLPDVEDRNVDENLPLTIFLYNNYKNLDYEKDLINLNKLENTAFLNEKIKVLI